ncbi:hypothetical protein SAMN05421788_105111 [Filimonas lacunae]|uniref:Uncharacterized protein n=1 Tax=Filimonas lacunae TaxID=477680 RepID=A0A173MD02_9BACT|nr:hypothetical protein [Filimonas lacunae]BAV05435.1 hypothetical protein FLA_1442 [Filimonas lacunae]SIT21154.1 hypothetical protein SAMN05421788_105111 [Filimonas lacunae]
MAITTYAQWTDALERFSNGDNAVLAEFNSGSFSLDAGTAQRFYIRVEEAYRNRKKVWVNSFQRAFHTQTIASENELGITLNNSRKNMIPLVSFVTAKGLPEDLKNTLYKDLCEFVAEVKKTLTDNIVKNNKSSDRLLMVLHGFDFMSIITAETSSDPTPLQQNNVPPATGRKIIF